MIKLSVALATYNEENNIEKCLVAISDIADEIIIVDGSSQDKTVEIAKKNGAQVIAADNPPIFHINKQKAIDKCKGEWILQLDADEIIPQDLKIEIKKTIDSQTEFNAFWIKRKNFFLGKWLSKGGQYPDPVIRLFRKGKAYLPCQSVHEQMEVDGKIGWLEKPMLHYSSPNFSKYLTNANRYTLLTAEEFKKEGIQRNLGNHIKFLILKPISVFFNIYIRHLGIVDGFAGFIFAIFSGLHFPIAYIKYLEIKS